MSMTPMASAFPDARARQPMIDIGRTGRMGVIASLGFLGLALAWANFTQISGAVITPGQAAVPGKPRIVQSLDGGMVKTIAVADGDRVQAGQVLMQLDPTLTRMKLDIAKGRLASALALRSRLEAEQAGAGALTFQPVDLPFDLPGLAQAQAGQSQIFLARAGLRDGRAGQLTERLAQLGNQITGVEARITAQEEQLVLLESELANQESLLAKQMIRKSEVLDLQSRRAGLMGAIAGDRSERARLENAISDARIEASQAESGFQEQVATDLRTVTDEVEQLMLEIVQLSAEFDRVEIRAPADGMVHELQVTTEGGVVAPGAVILQIVPQSGEVEFEMRLSAQELERVHVGQKADLVFASLDQRTTPRLTAQVASVSPAAITDPQSGQSYYRLMLAITPDELARLGDIEILPGMPVQAFLQTGDRSVMSYLLSPLTYQLSLAFREE